MELVLTVQLVFLISFIFFFLDTLDQTYKPL